MWGRTWKCEDESTKPCVPCTGAAGGALILFSIVCQRFRSAVAVMNFAQARCDQEPFEFIQDVKVLLDLRASEDALVMDGAFLSNRQAIGRIPYVCLGAKFIDMCVRCSANFK